MSPADVASETFTIPQAAYNLPATAGSAGQQLTSNGSISQWVDSNRIIYQVASPTTGQTVTMNNNTGYLVLTPAGLLGSLSITFPSTPADGSLITVTSSQVLSVLSLGVVGGQLLSSAGILTALGLGGFFSYVYVASTTTWFRCG